MLLYTKNEHYPVVSVEAKWIYRHKENLVFAFNVYAVIGLYISDIPIASFEIDQNGLFYKSYKEEKHIADRDITYLSPLYFASEIERYHIFDTIKHKYQLPEE